MTRKAKTYVSFLEIRSLKLPTVGLLNFTNLLKAHLHIITELISVGKLFIGMRRGHF